jgi:hypothetical protein
VCACACGGRKEEEGVLGGKALGRRKDFPVGFCLILGYRQMVVIPMHLGITLMTESQDRLVNGLARINHCACIRVPETSRDVLGTDTRYLVEDVDSCLP